MNEPKSETKTTAKTTAKAKSKLVLVDYHGTVGASRGQAEVDHVDSPIVLWLPKVGLLELILQPGLNRVPEDLLGVYKAESKAVQSMVDAGEIKELSELPTGSALRELIERSADHSVLLWVQEQFGKPSVYDNDGAYVDPEVTAKAAKHGVAIRKALAKRLSQTRGCVRLVSTAYTETPAAQIIPPAVTAATA